MVADSLHTSARATYCPKAQAQLDLIYSREVLGNILGIPIIVQLSRMNYWLTQYIWRLILLERPLSEILCGYI
jgi:hypothetical protein